MVRLEQLMKLLECDTSEKWGAALCAIAEICGYDHALFGVVPEKKIPFEQAFLQSNYSKEWRSKYDILQLHTVDPVVTHCLGSALPIVWDGNTFRSKEQNEFYEEAKYYGLLNGISLPVHGATGEFGVLSFASSEKNADALRTSGELLAAISLIRDYALESSRRFQNQEKTEDLPKVNLTRRELECLKWVMCGKSSWEVGQILSCSEATINFHIENSKKKFKVMTRQQAVVKAIQQGLLSL